ncbi:hypothetical protein N8737_01135 [Verrucomicrobia bacterium]|jgi:hypothetical protein|nr:hypothetical protein [Verrucomicrobiota bacterium]MDA7657281.1 hypothetical protein [Verrucomicrobiota bacterium]MDB4746194.1 hypothetical protein [Verrucomicrobiota bacterium]
MMIASEIIEQTREHPEEEQLEIVITISSGLFGQVGTDLSEELRKRIENVLLERIDGPFNQPTRDEFRSRVAAEVARLNREVHG